MLFSAGSGLPALWPEPEGFLAFWEETTAQAMAAPLDWQLVPQFEIKREGFGIRRIKFRGIEGGTLWGWVAEPVGVDRGPGFLWIPPYSRWSMLPNEYGTREGCTSLSLNFFGEDSFHQEVYTPSRGYFAHGAESPETWVYRRMYQDAVIAFRILGLLDSVNRNRMAACGMSQGAGMAIWMGAFCPGVECVCADMPFLGAIHWVLHEGKVHRYPLKELIDWRGEMDNRAHELDRTLGFFDTAIVAGHCRVPVQLTLGLKDPAVKPVQVEAVFARLAGEKALDRLDWGHDWHESMVERNHAWMDRWLGPSKRS